MASNTTYGEGLGRVRRVAFAALTTFTANTTVTRKTGFGVPVGTGKIRIVSLGVMADAVPSDADGTMLMTVRARDISEGAFDTLVLSADLETLVTAADRYFALTLATETTSELELTLEEGDTIDVQLVNNSAAIDVNPNLFLAVEYFPVPTNPETAFVRHPSAYIP